MVHEFASFRILVNNRKVWVLKPILRLPTLINSTDLGLIEIIHILNRLGLRADLQIIKEVQINRLLLSQLWIITTSSSHIVLVSLDSHCWILLQSYHLNLYSSDRLCIVAASILRLSIVFD